MTLGGETDRRERFRGASSSAGHEELTKGEVMAVDLEGKVVLVTGGSKGIARFRMSSVTPCWSMVASSRSRGDTTYG